jgi:phospholipase/carboxylesterase
MPLTIIFLHGLGDTAENISFLKQYFEEHEFSDIRWIFLQAPIRPVTLNGGFKMPAWYDIFELRDPPREDEAGIENSAKDIRVTLDTLIANGTKSESIILAGFSQGGAMALYTALRYPHQLAGAIGLSTYLIGQNTLHKDKAVANQFIPLLLCHGSADPILPLSLFRRMVSALEAENYLISAHVYDNMAHEISPEVVREMKAFLTTLIEEK